MSCKLTIPELERIDFGFKPISNRRTIPTKIISQQLRLKAQLGISIAETNSLSFFCCA